MKQKKMIWKKENATESLLLALAGGLFLLTVLYMFTIWNLGFHSDMASANMLAREQVRTGQWFPETWNWSTGITIASYNILIVPLSLFTGNQLVLRNLAVLIVLVTVLILLRHLSKKYLQSNFYLVFLCFFFSNTSPAVRSMAFAEAAYLWWLLKSVLLFILVFKAFDQQFALKSKKWLVWLLLYITYLSLSGILSMAYYMVPLLGGMVLYVLLEHWEASFESIKGELRRWLKTLFAVLAAVAVGLMAYRALAAYTGFRSGTNITYPEASNLANQFVQFILSAIGYQTGVSLFSLEGLMNAIVLFGFVAVIVCCVLLFTRYREQPFPIKLMMHFGLLVNAIHLYFIFTNYCLNIGEIRYFFRPMMFLWLLAAYYIDTYVLTRGFLPKAVAVAAIAVFSLPYMLAGIPQLVQYPQAREEQMGVVNFLKDHDLKHGYATFWNAGKNMVLSDFEIEIGSVLLNDKLKSHLWLSSDTTYNPDAYEGESFLLLTQEEDTSYSQSSGMASLGEWQERLTHGAYVIYTYPHNIAKNGFIGQDLYESLLWHLHTSDAAMRQGDGTVSLSAGQVIYGPYITLDAGRYEVEVEFEQMDAPVSLLFTGDSGQVLIGEQLLTENYQKLVLETTTVHENFETVFHMTEQGGSVLLRAVKLTRID